MSTIGMILCVLLIGSDPVSGSVFYLPQPGESAVLHHFNSTDDVVESRVNVWLNPAALADFTIRMVGEELTDERLAAMSDSESMAEKKKIAQAVAERQRQRIYESSIKDGHMIKLPDMTPVRVLGVTQLEPSATHADTVIIIITDGPRKGTTAFINRYSVRVPGSKAPDSIVESPAPTAEVKKKPAPKAKQPKARAADVAPAALMVLSQNEKVSDSGNYLDVTIEVKNTTAQPITTVNAKMIFRDATGNIVTTQNMFIGDIGAGASRTGNSPTRTDPRIVRYDLEFTSEYRDVIPHSFAQVGRLPGRLGGRKR